jgi:hypothetical protein
MSIERHEERRVGSCRQGARTSHGLLDQEKSAMSYRLGNHSLSFP